MGWEQNYKCRFYPNCSMHTGEKEMPERHHQEYTTAEIKAMIAMYKAGRPHREIAHVLNRTYDATRQAIAQLRKSGLRR